jgi:hypothetical protein
MKSKTYGCYCYNIHKNDLARPNASPCTDCVSLGLTQPCYHKPVSDTIINESPFGLPGTPSNWKFPLNEDGTMGELKFSNWRARRILEHLND